MADFFIDVIWICLFINVTIINQGFSQESDSGLGILEFSLIISIINIVLKGLIGIALGMHIALNDQKKH